MALISLYFPMNYEDIFEQFIKINILLYIQKQAMGNFPYVARASFFKEIGGLLHGGLFAGSSQSKQLRIEK